MAHYYSSIITEGYRIVYRGQFNQNVGSTHKLYQSQLVTG